MNILAIATATPQVSAALGGPDGVRASFAVSAGRRHAETLAPGLDWLTRAAGVPLEAVDLLAVDTGPGLFTGLRVGLATAKALGSALGRPVVPASSLDLLAEAQADGRHPHGHDRPDGADHPIAAVVDARRHEVFWRLYRPGTPPTPLADARVTPPESLAGVLADLAGALVVGDGGRRYAEVLAAANPGVRFGAPATDHPSAVTLLATAARRAGEAVPAGEVTPIYLRHADVRIGWAERPVEPRRR